MKRLIYVIIAFVLLLGAMLPATLRMTAQAELGRYDSPDPHAADEGITTFAFYDWGGLSGDTLRTNAVPWKLAEAALALHLSDGDVDAASILPTAEIFRPFGFHVPDRIANWPDTLPAPALDGPLGVVRGQSNGFTLASVEIANTGCAACHSSVVYDASGAPDTGQVWLGGTNASLNLAGYTDALFDALLTYGDGIALLQVANARFADMTWREQATLRFFVLPQLMDELRARDDATGRLLPFRPSHIGATNGYDSLRLRLGLIGQNDTVDQSYFTSIPALGDRIWRSRFLSSGVYTWPDADHSAPVTAGDMTAARRDAQARIVAYFLLPSMGVSEQVAIEQHQPARRVMDWLAEFESQPYPAPINSALAGQGRDIYAMACARCHGTYDTSLDHPSLVSFPNWEGDIDTHPGPPLDNTEGIADAVNASTYQPYIVVRPTTLRSAPPLGGLWSSAPYLANGSVPTLWHLMRPDQRPRRFRVGGHRLDLTRVGIDLTPPETYVPWAGSDLFDGTVEGRSPDGHTVGFDGLNDAQKDALLEYLKLL